MDNKNIDIFKVVEEANKHKETSNKNIDDIYNMLDDIKKDSSIDDIKESVTKLNSNNVDYVKTYEQRASNLVKRPSLAKVKDSDFRYNCFCEMLKNVDYGISNSNEYVEGHNRALNKYLKEALNNQDDLYIVEGVLNDELNKDSRSSSLEAKGYRDGLYYVYQALKESKRIFTEKIYKELKNAL